MHTFRNCRTKPMSGTDSKRTPTRKRPRPEVDDSQISASGGDASHDLSNRAGCAVVAVVRPAIVIRHRRTFRKPNRPRWLHVLQRSPSPNVNDLVRMRLKSPSMPLITDRWPTFKIAPPSLSCNLSHRNNLTEHFLSRINSSQRTFA